MKGSWLSLSLAFLAASFTARGEPNHKPSIILVQGAVGDAEYADEFSSQIQQWTTAAEQGEARHVQIGLDGGADPSDLERLRLVLEITPRNGPNPLWLVLIGHGTFDGTEARFNLRGPDLKASDLAAWLQPFERPVVVINTASGSAPFLTALSATNRIVATATRSGHELNVTRFGRFLAGAWHDDLADLDQDGQVSLLEACIVAGNQVREFYREEGRLVTEHALIDDNGDGLGTPLEWFRGVRAVKVPREGAHADGIRARQLVLVPSALERALSPEARAQRDALELAIEDLRHRKAALAEVEYDRQLEELLLKMARLLVTADEEAKATPNSSHE